MNIRVDCGLERDVLLFKTRRCRNWSLFRLLSAVGLLLIALVIYLITTGGYGPNTNSFSVIIGFGVVLLAIILGLIYYYYIKKVSVAVEIGMKVFQWLILKGKDIDWKCGGKKLENIHIVTNVYPWSHKNCKENNNEFNNVDDIKFIIRGVNVSKQNVTPMFVELVKGIS